MTNPTINTGSAVTDLKIPESIEDAGFASDGAWHIDQDSNNEAKLTWDITRHKPNIVLHKPMFKTGIVGSETDHLIGHWKCDDNAANSTVADEVGSSDANWEDDATQSNRNTDNDSLTDSIRGRGLHTKSLYFIDMPCGSGTIHDNDFYKKGSILISFKPQFVYTIGSAQFIFELNVNGADETIKLYYHTTVDAFRFAVDYSTLIELDAPAYTSNNDLQQFHTVMCSWDSDQNLMVFTFDGKVAGTAVISDAPGASHPVVFAIGCNDTYGSDGNIIIDEIKTFDSCILSYGAYFTGNGEVNVDVAHKDILFYWNGSDCTASNISIGAIQGTKGGSGGTFQTSGGLGNVAHYFDTEGTAELHFTITNTTHITYDKGSILVWFNIQTIADNDYIFGVGDANDHIQADMDASGNIDVVYTSQGTSEIITGDIACGTGEWHCLQITFDDSEGDVKVHSYIDDVENGTAQTIANIFVPNSSDVLYLGADYAGANISDIFIDEVYWIDNPHTPQIWTAFGKPLHQPLLEVT